MQVSAVIITFNEERYLERALASLAGLVDEIVVLDSGSTDGTKAICERHGVRFQTHPFDGHIEQKNRALDLARHDWVLSLDGDEALSEELRASLRAWRAAAPQHSAYEVARLTRFCGRWIRHAGWYPDRKVRLFDRRVGRWGGQNPHDRVVLPPGAAVGRLEGDLLHHSYDSVAQQLEQIERFSTIGAQAEDARGRRSRILPQLVLGPAFTFLKKYLLQGGFREGYLGFVICVNTAWSRYLKYLKLRELQRARAPDPATAEPSVGGAAQRSNSRSTTRGR